MPQTRSGISNGFKRAGIAIDFEDAGKFSWQIDLDGNVATAMSATIFRNAYLGLGSNQGSREKNIRQALKILACNEIRLIAVSDFMETDPIGVPAEFEHLKFLNGAAHLTTTLTPQVLLERLLQTEVALGRIRSTRNAPRPVDLDLLLYDEAILTLPGLTLPHPRLHERLFVLKPLIQIAPTLEHPILQCSIKSLIERLEVLEPSRRQR